MEIARRPAKSFWEDLSATEQGKKEANESQSRSFTTRLHKYDLGDVYIALLESLKKAFSDPMVERSI